MALSAPTANRLDFEGNPGSYYLEYTGVASGVIYRAYCSAQSGVTTSNAQMKRRWKDAGGAVAGSVVLDTLPDWPHVYVVVTASDVNDANESVASSAVDCPLSR
jgi:hypothetical protein